MARTASAVAGPSRDRYPQIPHMPRKDSLPCHPSVIPRSSGRVGRRGIRHPSAAFRPWRRRPRSAYPPHHGRRRAPSRSRRLQGRARRPRRARRPLALALRQRAPADDAGDRPRLAGHGPGRVRSGTAGAVSCSCRRARSLWPLLGLWALAVFQLIPLPRRPAPLDRARLRRRLAPRRAGRGRRPRPRPAPHLALPRGHPPLAGLRHGPRRPGAGRRPRPPRAPLSSSAPRSRSSTGAVLVSVYGFVARLAFGDKLFGVWTVPTIAPFGPFVSKNHFAGYVELAALLAVGLAAGLADEARHGEGWLSWIDSRRAKWVVLAWGAALVLVLAVPVSLSRGGVVSLTAGLACFVLLRLWARKGSRLSGRGLVGGAGRPRCRGPAARRGPAHGGPRPRPHPHRHHERPVRLVPPGSLARHPAPRGLEPRGRLRLRRLRGRAPPLQDRGRRLPRPARRERPPRAPGRRRPPRRPPGRGGRPRAPAPRPEGPSRHGAPPRPVSPRGRARRRSRGLRPHRLRLQPPHPVERADGVAPRRGRRCGSVIPTAAPRPRRATRDPPSRPGFCWSLSPCPSSPPSPPPGASPAGTRPPWRVPRPRRAPTSDGRPSRATSPRFLRRRPGQAPAWVQLGWLRLPASREDGSALARWGVGLDPRQEELARVSAPLREAAR